MLPTHVFPTCFRKTTQRPVGARRQSRGSVLFGRVRDLEFGHRGAAAGRRPSHSTKSAWSCRVRALAHRPCSCATVITLGNRNFSRVMDGTSASPFRPHTARGSDAPASAAHTSPTAPGRRRRAVHVWRATRSLPPSPSLFFSPHGRGGARLLAPAAGGAAAPPSAGLRHRNLRSASSGHRVRAARRRTTRTCRPRAHGHLPRVGAAQLPEEHLRHPVPSRRCPVMMAVVTPRAFSDSSRAPRCTGRRWSLKDARMSGGRRCG